MDIKLLGLLQEYSFIDSQFSNKIKLQLPNGLIFLAEVDIDTAMQLTGQTEQSASIEQQEEEEEELEEKPPVAWGTGSSEQEAIFPSEDERPAAEEVNYDPGLRVTDANEESEELPVPNWHNPTAQAKLRVQKNEFGYPVVSGVGLKHAPNNPSDEDGLESL